MLALADLYMGRDENGHYNNATDARVAINCVDKPAVTDRAKVVEEDRRAREAAPFMSYGEFTGHAPLGTCAFWPVPPTRLSRPRRPTSTSSWPAPTIQSAPTPPWSASSPRPPLTRSRPACARTVSPPASA